MALRKVTFDGQRSMKRKFFAEKGIDKLSMLQMTTKKVEQWDGFQFRTSNILGPDLKSSHITAPTGVVVICTAFNGTFITEMDYWKAGPVMQNRMRCLDYLINQYETTGQGEGSIFKALLNGQPETEILLAYPYFWAGRMRGFRLGSYYDLEPGGGSTPDSYEYPDDWPLPIAAPDPGEKYWLSFCGTDLLPWDNDNWFTGITTQETFLCPYDNDGSAIGGRTTFLEQVLWSYRPVAVTQHVPVTIGTRAIRPVNGIFYFFDPDRYYATITTYSEATMSYERIFLESILPDIWNVEKHIGDLMPSELREIVLTELDCTCRPLWTYSFSTTPDRKPVIYHIIDLTNSDNNFNNNGSDVEYFEDNPSQRKWKLSLHVNDTETGDRWSVTSSQFLSLLNTKARELSVGSNPQDADYGAANDVLMQFFGRPSHYSATPHDTSTFHNEDGDVYTWTRYYGVIKFTRDGIFDVETFVVPSIVDSTEGIRPTIRYSGQDDEGHGLYLCVCENLEEPKKVHELYYGSPFEMVDFTNWVPIPVPTTEQGDLVHIRIVQHDQNGIILFGILRAERETGEGVKNFYFLGHLVYSVTKVENIWSVTAMLPVDVVDPVYGERASWDICAYGGTELVAEMMSYLSPPAAMSQVHCGPYNGYKSGLP